MGHTFSPLRYPGGKSFLVPYLVKLIGLNNLQDGIFIEPYAGGGGAALKLLLTGHVDEIYLNDADKNIFNFWKCCTQYTEEFIKKITDTKITLKEWHKQKAIYSNPQNHTILETGFATFFLNRCNRSGIITGGIIGGLEQTGNYKIDARFNKKALTEKIERIALYNDKISLFNLDTIAFIKRVLNKRPEIHDQMFVYFDPPYYNKAEQLYLNYYDKRDHEKLSEVIGGQHDFRWMLSYDNVEQISELYSNFRQKTFALNYSAAKARIGTEILIYSDSLIVPDEDVSSLILKRKAS